MVNFVTNPGTVNFVPKPETTQTAPVPVATPEVATNPDRITVVKIESALNEFHATVLQATAYIRTLIG